MQISSELQAALDLLNAEQREAVEHLDGPLLVVAGPGTGKTQLLSLRAANILAKRDASPENILCLTYTEAGAEAMRKRLIELIGRDAYGIQVSTFHSFASSVRAAYPDHFKRSSSDQLATDLYQTELMDTLLKKRPFGDVLASRDKQGKAHYSKNMLSFVSKVKRSGISYDALAEIAKQNIAAAEWLEENSALCEIASLRASARVVKQFEDEVERSCAAMPRELMRPVVSTPGVYVPFSRYLYDMVRQTELVSDNGRTSGYTALRTAFFDGSNAMGRYFAIKKTSEKLLAACDVATSYQEELDDNNLYDYDDMILDFVRAVESDADLRQALQDKYTYLQVDEFQDTNGAQMRIVELLCEGVDQPNIMAVGDDDQAIMRFQGASVECINQFVARYHPHSVVLKTNYRSTPAVVELGQKVAAQIEHRLAASSDKAIRASRSEGDQTKFVELVYQSKAEEYAALAKRIRARVDAGYIDGCEDPNKAIAVISPKHAVLRGLIPYLVAEDIPFAYKQKQNLFTSERMQTVLALMRSVTALSQGREALAESCLPQIICAPELGGNRAESVRFALFARSECHGRWLQAMKASHDERIISLYGQLMEWAAQASSAPVRELLFDIAKQPLAYYRKLHKTDSLAAAEFNSGMRALLNFIEGELAIRGARARATRLEDVVERLEAAELQDVSIDISINLDAPGAVRLTSAHSSKGLEFDCVYLVDAEDTVWHKGAAGGSLYPANLLLGDERDEDDARRLLFVAVTRAKRHLEFFRSTGTTVRELSGFIESEEIELNPMKLDRAIEIDWHEAYRLDTPDLMALLDVRRDVRHLSASALNTFVTYQPGCENSKSFPEKQVLRLPEKPAISLEFGTIVHAMMEDISNFVMGSQGTPIEAVIASHRQSVEWMDFPKTEIGLYLQRFDRICALFVPWLLENAAGHRRVAEAKLEAMTAGGTPLFGYLDLLLVDDEQKTVRIVDYKTGLKHEVPAGYERQLRFYKLLVELSPQFEGYTVISMGDFYVEPEKETGELHPPFEVAATESEIRGLERLIDVVWKRIQAGAWDTSSFEQSERYSAAVLEREGARTKKDGAAIMQRAYEEWLVEEGAN